ncbi:MAG: hypothetical protein M1833_000677 [Piccolia ochrophora]|nr:MAG: hypothetical protein M1833_000677 [Piccolia ochrophora]
MYLPRSLISHLYKHLLRTHHPLSPPVLVLAALDADSLCACRILTTLLKRDYIHHKIQPVAGYGDLASVGDRLVRPMRTTEGGDGGVVICLGVGGLVDLGTLLGFDVDEAGEEGMGGVTVWVIDSRRPWNLENVFGGLPSRSDADGQPSARKPEGTQKGRVLQSYQPREGGIVVFDDGDIDDDLQDEREAYCALQDLPDVDDDGEESDGSGESDDEDMGVADEVRSKKRKSWSDREEEDSETEEESQRPRQKRRSNSSTSIPSSPRRPAPRGLVSMDAHETPSRSHDPSPVSSAGPSEIPPSHLPPSTRTLRRRLFRMRRKHELVLRKYYGLGTSYSEPVSSIMYSLASELGRDDNDLLWMAIVGVSSLELYGRSMIGVGIGDQAKDEVGGNARWGGDRAERIRQILRDEVRRLNPPALIDAGRDINRWEMVGVIPTHARSPTDNSIRLSPEPRFLLIRHWSLYDSMLHSPYLSARLHVWSDTGRKRFHKFLAKMGFSLTQCKQSYTHMDMKLKRDLRASLLKCAPVYGLDGLVPPDAHVGRGREGWGFVRNWGFKACLSAADVGVVVGAILEVGKAGVVGLEGATWDDGRSSGDLSDAEGKVESEEWIARFWEAYDALENIDALRSALPTAMHLHRAILRTGTSLLEKRQIRHLRAFRMAVVKDGPDVQLFTHPAALTKLALWVGEAIAEQEREQRGKLGRGGKGTPLVVAGLNERRGVYVIVGTGGGGGVADVVGRRERKAAKDRKRTERDKKREERERRRKEREDARDEDGEDETEEEDSDASSSEDDEDDDSDDDDANRPRGYARNNFGNAFQAVVAETNARVRIDSFEHCVVEVRKEDLAAFLESLSLKAVVG